MRIGGLYGVKSVGAVASCRCLRGRAERARGAFAACNVHTANRSCERNIQVRAHVREAGAIAMTTVRFSSARASPVKYTSRYIARAPGPDSSSLSRTERGANGPPPLRATAPTDSTLITRPSPRRRALPTQSFGAGAAIDASAADASHWKSRAHAHILDG